MKKAYRFTIIVLFFSLSMVAQAHFEISSDRFTLMPSKQDIVQPNLLKIASLKSVRTALRDFLSFKFNDNVEIGLDSFKVRPLEIYKSHLREVDAYLQSSPQNQPKTNRGYGIEFRIKLP